MSLLSMPTEVLHEIVSQPVLSLRDKQNVSKTCRILNSAITPLFFAVLKADIREDNLPKIGEIFLDVLEEKPELAQVVQRIELTHNPLAAVADWATVQKHKYYRYDVYNFIMDMQVRNITPKSIFIHQRCPDKSSTPNFCGAPTTLKIKFQQLSSAMTHLDLRNIDFQLFRLLVQHAQFLVDLKVQRIVCEDKPPKSHWPSFDRLESLSMVDPTIERYFEEPLIQRTFPQLKRLSVVKNSTRELYSRNHFGALLRGSLPMPSLSNIQYLEISMGLEAFPDIVRVCPPLQTLVLERLETLSGDIGEIENRFQALLHCTAALKHLTIRDFCNIPEHLPILNNFLQGLQQLKSCTMSPIPLCLSTLIYALPPSVNYVSIRVKDMIYASKEVLRHFLEYRKANTNLSHFTLYNRFFSLAENEKLDIEKEIQALLWDFGSNEVGNTEVRIYSEVGDEDGILIRFIREGVDLVRKHSENYST